MPTPYSKVESVFHSSFQSKQLLPPDLELQFFMTAIGGFELDLYELHYDEIAQEIQEDLKQAEINLLGKLMYKAYLQRERDRIIKLNNIIGKDIKLTGMSDSKFAVNKAYEDLSDEIQMIISKLKANSYYE